MAVTVSGTSITFNDGTVQSTAPGNPTTAQVLNATAGASAGAVGTYAFGFRASGDVAFGTAVYGSSIYTSSAARSQSIGDSPYTGFALNNGATLSGTWMAMGTYDAVTSFNTIGVTLWLRIT